MESLTVVKSCNIRHKYTSQNDVLINARLKLSIARVNAI